MNGKPYDPLAEAKEEYFKSLKIDSKIIIGNTDLVIAEVYSEELDIDYTISGINLDQLFDIIRHDKHLFIECIEVYIND